MGDSAEHLSTARQNTVHLHNHITYSNISWISSDVSLDAVHFMLIIPY